MVQGWLGITSVPDQLDPHWQIAQPWHDVEHGHRKIVLSSTTIGDECVKSPGAFLELSAVYMGNYILIADDRTIYRSGPGFLEDFRTAYGNPSVACNLVAGAKDVSLSIETNNVMFFVLKTYPIITNAPYSLIYGDYFYTFAMVLFLLLAVFSAFFFKHHFAKDIYYSNILQNIIFAGLFFFYTAGNWGIANFGYIAHHGVHICLWVGGVFLTYTLGYRYPLNPWFKLFTYVVGILCIILSFISGTHNSIQAGLLVFMFLIVPILGYYLVCTINNFVRSWNLVSAVEVVSVTIFFTMATVECLSTIGALSVYPLLPVGFISLQVLLFLSLFLEMEDIIYKRQALVGEILAHRNAVRSADERAFLMRTIAHDLKTPLGLVNSIFKTKPTTVDPSILARLGNRIEEIVKRLEKSPERVLSQVSAADVKLSIESICHDFCAAIGDLRIDIDVDSLNNKVFELDLSKFESMVINIINNSIEACPRHCRVVIKAEASEDSISLFIRDNGPGIAASKIDDLGQRKVTSSKPKGWGIGLLDAKTTVEKWGGRLSFKNCDPQGFEVQISLPFLTVR